ncbi:hypothetical protein C8R44DRAFT_875631 [Mycena epipterygia]|nr:hypothetical protein C8R44DRAFT_875631 [Mycena epipterygia]
MTANIVLPPLKTWAERHLSSIIKATTQNAFQRSKKRLQGEVLDEASTGGTIQFRDVVEVPAEKRSVQTGVAGLFYTATIFEKIMVLDAPAEKHVTSSLNLLIEEGRSLEPPGIDPFFDGRRVSALNQIMRETYQN